MTKLTIDQLPDGGALAGTDWLLVRRGTTTYKVAGSTISGDSGGDADTLDGLDSTAFARAVHAHAIGDVTGLQSALDGKQATIAAGTTAQYWRGDKTWQDLATAVRAAVMTGLSTATSTAVAATDTLLAAIGKLQAQVNGLVTGKLDATATAAAASKLATARALSVSGDATGSASFDGSADAAIALTLSASGVAAGTYPKVTVDTKGRVTAGSSLAATDIPALDASKITSGVIADARLPTRLGTVAATITDWNSATSNGWYMASNGSNAPVASTWFIGTVENHGANGWCTQTVHAFSTDAEGDTKTYRREQNNGVWGTWQRVRVTEAEQSVIYLNASNLNAGTVPDARLSGTYTGVNITGNAGTATTLQAARAINGVLFNGSADITVADSTKLPLSGGTLTGNLTFSLDHQDFFTTRNNATTTNTHPFTWRVEDRNWRLWMLGADGIGRDSIVADVNTGVVTFPQGYKNGAMTDPVWEGNLDFSSLAAGTWRKIATVSMVADTYSTQLFVVDVIDSNANQAVTSSVNTEYETYHVACIRAEDKTLNSPDMCIVKGPGSRIRAVKTAVGVYEIQIQNETKYREYYVKITPTVSNRNHAITYHNLAAPGTATATYTASIGASTRYFENVSLDGKLTATAPTTSSASITLPHGTAPTTLVNGDMWTTTAGVYARINGATRDLYHSGNLADVSQAEAEAGTATSRRAWTAQRVRQAVAAYAPSKAEATTTAAGLLSSTDKTKLNNLPGKIHISQAQPTSSDGNDGDIWLVY